MNNTIILQRELEEAAYQCRKALYKAQEAVRELYKLSDYPTPSTLAEVTTRNLLAFVEQRINAVKATPIYTTAEREERISDWIEWRIKAMPHVVAVENFVNEWKDVNPVLDTSDMSILTNDITEALKPRFTVEVPLQAHTHIAMIHNIKQAISDLREWEREQDIKKVPLQELTSLKEDNLLQSWANGNIKINHQFDDDASLVAWRKAQSDATF